MGMYKEKFIAIQNLKRCVEFELNNLEIEGDEKRNFLISLSNEISMINQNPLKPFSKIRMT